MNATESSPPATVLAIDDEPDILHIICEALELGHYRVLTAESPEEGIRVYEQRWREVQLVLLDYLMPSMTGDLVFEWLQRINPDVRVILLTACDERVGQQMFAHGLRGYIQKPFFIDDLLARVREEIETQ